MAYYSNRRFSSRRSFSKSSRPVRSVKRSGQLILNSLAYPVTNGTTMSDENSYAPGAIVKGPGATNNSCPEVLSEKDMFVRTFAYKGVTCAQDPVARTGVQIDTVMFRASQTSTAGNFKIHGCITPQCLKSAKNQVPDSDLADIRTATVAAVLQYVPAGRGPTQVKFSAQAMQAEGGPEAKSGMPLNPVVRKEKDLLIMQIGSIAIGKNGHFSKFEFTADISTGRKMQQEDCIVLSFVCSDQDLTASADVYTQCFVKE